jgi:hypothetical protein
MNTHSEDEGDGEGTNTHSEGGGVDEGEGEKTSTHSKGRDEGIVEYLNSTFKFDTTGFFHLEVYQYVSERILLNGDVWNFNFFDNHFLSMVHIYYNDDGFRIF